MAVDEGVDAVAAQGLFDCVGRGVGDGFHGAGVLHRALARLAGGAGLLGEGEAGLEGLGEHVCAPLRAAYLGADLLVFDVAGAQQVAVHQQHGLAVKVDHRGVGKDPHARAGGVVAAEHEVAVAVHEEQRHAGGVQGGELAGNEGTGFGGVVIANPGFEQVTEDVERVGAAGLAVEEVAEQAGDLRAFRIQVEVGDEQRGHRTMITAAGVGQ